MAWLSSKHGCLNEMRLPIFCADALIAVVRTELLAPGQSSIKHADIGHHG